MRKRFLLIAAFICAAVSAGRADVIENGLVGYWSGNGNANDSSPTDNNGTFAGSYVPGVGGAEAFDLSTGFVTMPDVPAYSLTGDYSVDIWFNANGTGGGSFVGQDNGSGSQAKWILDYGYGYSGFVFHLNGPGGEVFLHSNPMSVPTGWNNLALVKSGDDYTFYLNGTSIGSQTSSVAFSNPTANLIFGSAGGDVPSYYGYLQDVAIYDRALSNSEVDTLANVAVPEPACLPSGLALFALMGIGTKTRARRGRWRAVET